MSKILVKAFQFCVVICLFFSCSPKKKDAGKEAQSSDTSHLFSPVELLTQKIKVEPANAELYYKRSQYYLAAKRLTEALVDINKALSIDSAKSPYYLVLGDVSFAGFNVPKAEESFQKAIALDNTNIEAYLKYAELELYLKKYTESITNANEALRIDKHRAKAYFIKGFVYAENLDTGKAISSFQTCIEQEPSYYDAYIQLGILFAGRLNPLALEYYNRALKLRPNSTEAYYDRGFFYQEAGELDKAISDYNALLKINLNYKEAYYNIGYIELAYRSDYKKAIEYFGYAIEKDKYYTDAYYNRGYSYEMLGDKENAKKDYLAAISVVPTYKKAIAGMKRLGL